METTKFATQLYQSKFTFSKIKASKNFREFTRFFQCLNLKQIQCKFIRNFASRNFNSNSVWNLNFLPNEKLFVIFHSIRFQSLVNFGAQEVGFHNLQIRFSLEK
jgi:hypothetical protein